MLSTLLLPMLKIASAGENVDRRVLTILLCHVFDTAAQINCWYGRQQKGESTFEFLEPCLTFFFLLFFKGKKAMKLV